MGCSLFSHFDCFSQGGGVYILNGDVTFTNTQIYGNTASGLVSACLLNLPIDPMGFCSPAALDSRILFDLFFPTGLCTLESDSNPSHRPDWVLAFSHVDCFHREAVS